jgi:hypothetical protein
MQEKAKRNVWQGSLSTIATLRSKGSASIIMDGEFDPGSGETLAACLTHASRTLSPSAEGEGVADG